MKSPFKFLDAYEKKDKEIFFGRQEDVEQLYELAHQSNLLLVYGQSGTGKTSLIQCGLANRFLATDWFDLYVRRQNDINETLRREISKAARTPIKPGVPLAQALHSLYLDFLKPVYLIFDQFEELFILGSPQEQRDFIQTVAGLLQSETNCRLIFVIREEYLAMLHDFEKAVPTLFNKRFRVEPMSRHNVQNVISGTTAAFGIVLEHREATAQQIIGKLSDHRAGVQLSYLQVYLDKLYRSADAQRKDDEPVVFNEQLVEQIGALGDVLADFLEEQTAAVQQELANQYRQTPAETAQLILEEFATLEGTKQPKLLDELAEKLPTIPENIIAACLAALEQRRILRNFEGVYELAHDTLAGRIADKRSVERKQLLKIWKLVNDRYSAYEQTRTWLNKDELRYISPYLAKLELSPFLKDFVHKSRKHLRWIMFQRIQSYAFVVFVVIAETMGIYVWMFRVKPALHMPQLRAWHQPGENEILPNDKFTVFSKYVETEARFIETAYRNAEPDAARTGNRYERASLSSPYSLADATEASQYGPNGNASFSDRPTSGPLRGGVLLVHGLSDSPYQMRAVARIFAEQGFFVIALRLPGHGTIPGALTNVTWEQWYDAVKVGVNMVRHEIRDVKDAKLILGGFSTGGALTLRYVLESVVADDPKKPDKLFLFSPAIAVPSDAQFDDWHKAISWIPRLAQFRWLEIKPEYDPYKYNSFPKNASYQIYDLTQANWKLVEELAADRTRRIKFPPIYGYQSILDRSVTADLLTELLAKIGNDQCESMLFDLNRAFRTYVLPEKYALDPLQPIKLDQFKATLYVVTNHKKAGVDQFNPQVKLTRYSRRNETTMNGEQIALADSLAWPANVFALSHGSIPISPQDPVYGESSILETINFKGERGVLIIESDLIRVRHNPFFALIKWHIEETLKH